MIKLAAPFRRQVKSEERVFGCLGALSHALCEINGVIFMLR